MSGAIAMVALGVLEHNPPPLFPLHQLTPEVARERMARDRAMQAKADEILRLVRDEVFELHWLLKSLGGNAHILLGPMEGIAEFRRRPLIGKGTLKEVCIAAMDYQLREARNNEAL